MKFRLDKFGDNIVIKIKGKTFNVFTKCHKNELIDKLTILARDINLNYYVDVMGFDNTYEAMVHHSLASNSSNTMGFFVAIEKFIKNNDVKTFLFQT